MGCLLKGGGGLYSRLVLGAVLLAAGEAKRMGGRPKPLLQLAGVPLIRRSLIALSGAGVDELVVVLGHRADEIEPAVSEFPVTVVRNPRYAEGQMSSVRAGLDALAGKLDAIVIALADQPLVNADDVAALIGAYKKRAEGRSIVVPYVAGERANPIVFDAALRDEIVLDGVDFGCRQWIERHPDRIERLDTANLHYRCDVDTPEDVRMFERRYGHPLRWPAGIEAREDESACGRVAV